MFKIQIDCYQSIDVSKEFGTRYLMSVVELINQRRFFTRKAYRQQIVLTKDLKEAETFPKLLDAQKRIAELQKINADYYYTVIEA